MLVIERSGGEYNLEFRYHSYVTKLFFSLTKTPEYKSFLLLDYISANERFIKAFENLEYKKISDHMYILSGKCLDFIANDNVYSGEIICCSETFSSLSVKRIVNHEYIAWTFKMKIKDDRVYITLRDNKLITQVVAFLIYLELGIVPSEFQVQNLALVLNEIIPYSSSRVEIGLLSIGKCYLLHKIMVSMMVAFDEGVKYCTLSASLKKWRIAANNLNKGAMNIFHAFYLKIFYFLKGVLEDIRYFGIYRYLINNRFTIAVQRILKDKKFRLFGVFFGILLGFFILLKVFNEFFILLIFIFWLVLIFFKKLLIFIHLPRLK